MSKAVKIGAVLLVVVGLAAAGFLIVRWRGAGASAQPAAPTAVVERGSIESTISATGHVASGRETTLAFSSSGTVAEVLAEEGEEVAAGQALARLDTSSLEWQLSRAQAGLSTARARLEQAQKAATPGELASARAALDSAQANLDKVRQGASAKDLASAQAALSSARSNLAKVKAGPTKDDMAAAQAAVDGARAALAQAQAAYDLIKDRPDAAQMPQSLSLQSATIDHDRAKANYNAAANRPTASELAAAQAQVAQAEAQLAQLKDRPTGAELAAALAQVAQAQAQWDQLAGRPNALDVAVVQAQVDEAAVAVAQAQSQLEDAVLSAPFGGTVLSVGLSEGEWASPGQPVVVLAETRPLLVEMNVDEVDVAQLATGQTAHLSFDALKGQTASGTVTRIAPASTNVAGAVAYPVEILFDPGSLPVRLGMTANVAAVVARADDALLVPNRAIEADRAAGRYFVNRQLPGGATQRVEVRIGLRDEQRTEILEGLEEGDVVVLPVLPSQTENRAMGPFGGGSFGGGDGQ